jgi:hypothetical protein
MHIVERDNVRRQTFPSCVSFIVFIFVALLFCLYFRDALFVRLVCWQRLFDSALLNLVAEATPVMLWLKYWPLTYLTSDSLSSRNMFGCIYRTVHPGSCDVRITYEVTEWTLEE